MRSNSSGTRVPTVAATVAVALGMVSATATAADVRPLYAGQTMEIGTVSVAGDANQVCVTYQLNGATISDGWVINETHLYIGTDDGFPMSPAKGKLGPPYNANPVPGKFPYGGDFDPGVDTAEHCVPLAELGASAGDDLYVAAHAVITKGYIANSGTVAGVSDATTEVTTGNVPSSTYPYAAVLAWVHPAWNTQLTEPLYNDAGWIWESTNANNPQVAETVTFEKTFSLPGAPASGTLSIAADNEFEAYLNGQLLGSYNSGWKNVQNFDLSSYLQAGDNTFRFVVTNWGVANSTVYSNPGGLIYKFDADWVDVQQLSESAWGDGSRFNEQGNWGMWFKTACDTAYTLNVLTVNGYPAFWHTLRISYDPVTESFSGTGTRAAGTETLSEFQATFGPDGTVTYIQFTSVYDENGYTWYPAFNVNAGGTLTFVERGGDNVNAATGNWTAEEACAE